jgi:hypothetical protein
MRGVIVVCGVLALGGVALGGQQWGNPVEVNLSAGYARGSLGDARSSADFVQMIGCYNSSGPGYAVVACEAQDASGVYKSCATSDPYMVASARSIGAGSYVFFRWDASGNCTAVHVTNYSTIRPMTP